MLNEGKNAGCEAKAGWVIDGDKRARGRRTERLNLQQHTMWDTPHGAGHGAAAWSLCQLQALAHCNRRAVGAGRKAVHLRQQQWEQYVRKYICAHWALWYAVPKCCVFGTCVRACVCACVRACQSRGAVQQSQRGSGSRSPGRETPAHETCMQLAR